MIKELHSKAVPSRGKSGAGRGVAALMRKNSHGNQEGAAAWNGEVGLVKSAVARFSIVEARWAGVREGMWT
jgi:hypothetical protein